MTHHMSRGVDLSWTRDLKHVFLIRSPERVIASYRQKMPSVSAEDIGIIRQRELFDAITAITGKRPPVVDSLDILNDPAHMLRQLCVALDLPWYEGAMTQWKVGSRSTDGVWHRIGTGRWSHQRSFHRRPRQHRSSMRQIMLWLRT